MFNERSSPGLRAALVALFSLVLALIYQFTDKLEPLKAKVQDFASPFYRTTHLPAEIGDWVENRTLPRERLVQELESLRTENLILKRKLQLNASLAAENVRLRQLLNSAEMLEERVLITEIIGRAPDPMMQQVVVNRGAKDGVYKGQALVDSKGLMGQVVEVGQSSAKVLLITDSTHAIPVKINRNGEQLIAEGVGGREQVLSLPYVANTLDIVVGDLLVSSGMGQRFPIGYPVAEVTQVLKDPSRRFALVSAKPLADIGRSRHALLVFNRPPSSDEP